MRGKDVKGPTTQTVVMGFMAAALVFGVFAPDAPQAWATWLKDAATAAAGLAALFMHPPTMQDVAAPQAAPSKPTALAPTGNPPGGLTQEKAA